MPKSLTLTDSRIIAAPLADVYRQLVQPEAQLQWNSLYLEASVSPPGEVRTGSVMVGRFKGSGRATVHFDDVRPNECFTHVSELKLLGLALGSFRHTYRVEPAPGGTRFTQHVELSPRGVGVLLASTLMKGFASRLPESFDEFARFVASRVASGSPQR